MTDLILSILKWWAIGMVPAFVIFTAFEATDRFSNGGVFEITVRTILWPAVIIWFILAIL